METQPPLSASRPGIAGLDIFKIAGQSVSGYLPGLKDGDRRPVRQPYTSLLELRLALYLEYHPHVRTFQRGDASPALATSTMEKFTTTCLILCEPSAMEGCSLPKLVERAKKARNKHWQKLRRPGALLN